MPVIKRPIDIKRPENDLETSEAEWPFFCSEWDIYKTRSGIKNEEITLELRAACPTELRRALYNFIGQAKLSTSDETTIKARNLRAVCQWRTLVSPLNCGTKAALTSVK